MERLSTAGLLFICFGYVVASGKTETIYFLTGKNVTLRPPSGSATPITNIIWRHKENLAAEWNEGTAVQTYLSFTGRTVLNTTSGYLHISNMREEEAGTYSVEINNLRLGDRYVVTKVEEPPKPSVWIRAEGDALKVNCQGNTDKAGPVTYWWDMAEDGSWVRLDPWINVQNNETTRRKETFSCKIVSPVAEGVSAPEPNPFHTKPSDNALAALVIPIAVALALIGVGIWKRDYIKERLCPKKANGKANDVSPNPNPDALPLNPAAAPVPE